MKPEKTLVDNCIEAFTSARVAIADALQMLWEVHANGYWSSKYSSWTEFCEDGLKISHSTASQYVKVYDHYVAQGGLAANELRKADLTKLYLATSTAGSAKDQYSRALTLSRSDLRDQRKEDDGHECEAVTLCKHCGKRMG